MLCAAGMLVLLRLAGKPWAQRVAQSQTRPPGLLLCHVVRPIALRVKVGSAQRRRGSGLPRSTASRARRVGWMDKKAQLPQNHTKNSSPSDLNNSASPSQPQPPPPPIAMARRLAALLALCALASCAAAGRSLSEAASPPACTDGEIASAGPCTPNFVMCVGGQWVLKACEQPADDPVPRVFSPSIFRCVR